MLTRFTWDSNSQDLIETGLLLKSGTELSGLMNWVYSPPPGKGHGFLSLSGHQHDNGRLRASSLGGPPG